MRAARGSRPALLVALAATLLASPTFACSVCYGSGATASPMITSARLGVFLLLGITAAVLGGFAKFFLYLRNRAEQAEADSIAAEWAQLQRSSLS
jgi:predicted alpha/beta hydrolase